MYLLELSEEDRARGVLKRCLRCRKHFRIALLLLLGGWCAVPAPALGTAPGAGSPGSPAHTRHQQTDREPGTGARGRESNGAGCRLVRNAAVCRSEDDCG